MNDEKKMDVNEATMLTDEQIAEVAGGVDYDPDGFEIIYGRNGKQIGIVKGGDRIMYWKCTHCGLPIYKEPLVYRCDKCNDWWLGRRYYQWNGTRESLIDEAAKTL